MTFSLFRCLTAREPVSDRTLARASSGGAALEAQSGFGSFTSIVEALLAKSPASAASGNLAMT
jgi:hypothetical protein